MSTRSAFAHSLKRKWLPLLQGENFSGGYRNQKRMREPFIDCFFFQSRSDHMAYCVNLGVHLTFLPVSGGGCAEDVTQPACEIQTRMAPAGHSDYWWSADDPEHAVESMIQVYNDTGRSFFAQFACFPKPFVSVCAEEVETKDLPGLFPEMTRVRIALLLARVHETIGNLQEMRRFAELGLRLSKDGTPRYYFKKMLGMC